MVYDVMILGSGGPLNMILRVFLFVKPPIGILRGRYYGAYTTVVGDHVGNYLGFYSSLGA